MKVRSSWLTRDFTSKRSKSQVAESWTPDFEVLDSTSG